MNTPVSAVLGAMGPLIWKLEVLLLEASEGDPKRWPRLPKGVNDGFHLLKEDLEDISSCLEDLSELEDPPLTAKCWMKEVRELSYDIEDYLDCFARPSCRTNIRTRSVYKISHVQLNRLAKRKKLGWHKQVRIKISEFRIRIREANERHERYELGCLNSRRRYAPSGPMLPRRHDEAADLVIDGQMSEFMDTLACHGDQQLKVVAITGSGGLGKTTFARVLFNEISGQFDCRAFIAMTRKPNIKKVLCDILTQVQRQQPRDECKDLDITGRIRKHLHDKRYLIVVDDLWAASAWNIISRAFPEGSQRSRIIITTPVENVALTCCCYQSELVFEMKSLDVYHSRKLFFNRIFGSECDCPETFKEVSYRIVEICGGSPLATINMASLLASHPVISMEQWEYISDSLSTKLKICSAYEGMKLVLNLSYNNLTHYLKTCLLYLNMYPDGCIICKDDLVKQWVAEGFIEATEGRDVESIARGYFDELIDRRFIQPACIKYTDEIVSCTVHDIVRDLIAYNSEEDNFVMVVDSSRKNIELSDKVRRLFLNFGDEMFAKKPRNIGPSHVRSLAFSGVFACMPSITEFKLLRVLNLRFSGHRCDEILELTGISELFQLKYLKVVSDVCIKLPKHMRGLQYLETLDIDTKVSSVPWDIIHLPCLLHLHLPFEAILTDWISGVGSDIVRRLDKFTNLLDLRLTCSTPPRAHLKRKMEALGSLLAGLGNLKSLAVVPGSPHENTVVRNPSKIFVSWDGFTPPLHIKKFEWSLCSCTFSRVPKWVGEFGNLCILKIVVKELLRDGVDILKGLTALTSLSLYVYAAPIERIVFDKAGFSVLKFFKFRCCVPWLKFEADAMPNLLELKLGLNANRMHQHGNAYIVIEHLPCLKQICAKIGGASDDADPALMAAVINHPRNPRINIRLVDWTFYGEEGSITAATREKEHGGMKKQDDIQYETEDELSREDAKKQADARIFTSSLSKLLDINVYPSRLLVSEGLKQDMPSQEDLFDVSEHTYLTNVNWDGGSLVPEKAGHGGWYCNRFPDGDSSDDEEDEEAAASSDATETIKGLVHCATLRERNLLADVCAHLERHRAAGARRRDQLRLVAASLRAAGHDAAVCVSRWDKSPSHPAGEHAYLDVLLPAASDRGARERVLVDVDFRSAFEVARPTKAYRALLQRLPAVFVGKEDRLRLLVPAAADAARASLKKRGLHFPPWRKPEYMRAKWLSPYNREVPPIPNEAAREVDGEGSAMCEEADSPMLWHPVGAELVREPS